MQQFANSIYGESAERRAASAEESALTLKKAIERAMDGDLPIICASTYGSSALQLMEMAQAMGCKSDLIVVRHHPHLKSDRTGVVQLMPKDREQKLLEAGVKIVTATHLFDGMSRAAMVKYKGTETGIVVSDTLRMFGHGMKVAVECAVMAMEAGYLEYPQKVVSIGGRGMGANTAIVTTPVPSSSFFELKIQEILCFNCV